MKYSNMLRRLFEGIQFLPTDLLLLESFQIKYLPSRVPHQEFATLIRNYSYIRDYFILKVPEIKTFIDQVLKENEEYNQDLNIDTHCNELLWEIADLIVYNKYPETYNEKVRFNWKVDDIIVASQLLGKTIADVGSGTGKLAFLLAKYARTVYAIEPVSSLRGFIRSKNQNNIFVLDGFLDSIPMPDNSLDILFTSNAIGWNIHDELREIERVVKPKGTAIHIMKTDEGFDNGLLHKVLASQKANYVHSIISKDDGIQIRYEKKFF